MKLRAKAYTMLGRKAIELPKGYLDDIAARPKAPGDSVWFGALMLQNDGRAYFIFDDAKQRDTAREDVAAKPAADLPVTGFLRLTQIIGRRGVSKEQAAANRAKGKGPVRVRAEVPALIPISASTWWDGVASGRYPAPVKIGAKATAWRVQDIRDLIQKP